MLDVHQLINGRTRRLSHIRRYSSLPVVRAENVAEHSWQVAYYSLAIGLDLIDRGLAYLDHYQERLHPDKGPLCLHVLLARAIMHDVSEAASGDIIRSYKYGTPEMLAATKAADARNTKELLAELGEEVGDTLLWWWTHAKAEDLEGRIVALADVLAVVGYVREEQRMGNGHLDYVLNDAYRNLLLPLREDPLFGTYVEQLFLATLPTNEEDE